MKYKCLNNEVFAQDKYAIVPIRFVDRFEIMKWRNEQMYHLRQNKPLTDSDQETYFSEIISKLFDHDKPDQILFSFLENNKCIGYGGLVHINWIDRNAEISFIMDTKLELQSFAYFWKIFLYLIEKPAFRDLNLHKIYTFAFDLRPHLYKVLIYSGFRLEARLTEHCFFEKKFVDVLIHSKFNTYASI